MDMLNRAIDWALGIIRKEPDGGGGKGGDINIGPGTTLKAGDAIRGRDGGSVTLKAGDGGNVENLDTPRKKGSPQ